jgi:hypothetical protein
MDMIEMKLTKYAVSSLWNLLTTTPVKDSRVEMRKHGGVMKGLKNPAAGKKPCMTEDVPGSDGWVFQNDGTLTVKQEHLDYVEDILDDAAKRGVPGNMAEGYSDLIDAIEAVKPTEKK